MHRSFTCGTLFLDETASDEDEDKYKIVIANGLDIFGQPIAGSKKNVCLVSLNIVLYDYDFDWHV